MSPFPEPTAYSGVVFSTILKCNHSTRLRLPVTAVRYGLVEGPRVDDRDRLYFSDAKRGGVYRRSPGGEVETIVPKR